MKIEIDYLVYKKMSSYIKHASGEISGLAKVEAISNELVRIVDIVLLHQICSGTSTDLQQDSIADFADEMIQRKEDMGAWRCWWHSHANMTTFWSNTDTTTIESLNPETTENNFFISMVGNKKNELLCRVDVFEPIRATIDKVDYEVVYSDKETDEACRLEVLEKVVEYTAPTTRPQQTTIVTYPMTPAEIAAEEEKKRQEELENFYTAEELGITTAIRYYVCSDGIFIFGKDGYWHKKLGKLNAKELRKVQKAIEKETDEYDKMAKEYYARHPEEKVKDDYETDENGVINYRREIYD